MSELGRLLASFRRSAFRLETRQHYSVPEEAEAFQHFLQGGPPESEWTQGFTDVVVAGMARGTRMQRVRVIEEPPSDYVRFELTWGYPINTGVGEQIHVLNTAPGQPAAPNDDFWLFDEITVARLRYDEDGRFLRAEIVTERDAVTRYCQLRDELLARATPLEQYMALARSS